MKQKGFILTIVFILLSILACNFPRPSPPEEPATTSPPEEQAPTQPAPPPPSTAAPPPEGPPAPTSLNVPLQIYNPSPQSHSNEPVTSGIPIPRDLGLSDPSSLRLVDLAGNPVPAQFTPLARWGGAPEDSTSPIRWVLVDFQASVGSQDTAYYYLQEGGPGPTLPQALVVTDGADAITVDTGVAQFSLSKTDGGLAGPGLAGPLVGRVNTSGTTYTSAGPVTTRVALEGPMRVSVHVQGAYTDPGGTPLLDYTSRYWFYAGRSDVRLFHTVENNTPCTFGEYEQLACYDIGSAGSVSFDDLSLIVPTGLSGSLTYQVGGQGQPASGDLSADLVLYQDSSGTDHWDHYPTLTDWDGNPLDASPRMQTYVSFRGYRTTLGGTNVEEGNQAAGWLSLASGSGSWSVGVRDFWQNFPKALRARPDGTIEIGLFPEEFGASDYAFNLRAGEHKTHEISLSPEPVVSQHPLFAAAPPGWYVTSGALGFTALPIWSDWPEHESYILHQLERASTYEDWMEWPPSLPASIEAVDFYGIFDYGDWPVDYEGYGVSPLNTKYDNNLGMWLQWARSGDQRWYILAQAANRHLADIDILHNLHSPRHWGDGIAFGHSYHDEEGFINPHRNYGGNHPDVAFGTAGLLLTYYLTGYEKAYDSALELADCIEYRVRNDVYMCDYFPDCNGEGIALGEGMYDAGSRPAANNLYIVVAAFRATTDQRYLAIADALVDWARPEAQPYINGPTGGDVAMNPWLLNMYLRSLAEYLEMRGEFGLPDTYNAASYYLAYADWLRDFALLELEPIDTGPRAAYPHEWWLDGRQGDPNDEYAVGNNVPSINNWLLLAADAMAYAYHLSGEADYLDLAERFFRTGSHDPWFVDDPNTYAQSKETANSTTYGHTFLYEWIRR